MYIILRSHHVRNTRFQLLKCYRDFSVSGQCICNFNCHTLNVSFIDPKRLYSISKAPGLILRDERLFKNYDITRNLHLTSIYYEKEPLKPSSKVEATVQELKKKKEEVTEVVKPVIKKSLKQKVIDEIVHYYHGFRLLFIDVKISSGLLFRVLRGKSLSRREHRLLMRTVGDLFRLVPFSVFIIVPFMELLLPVFIKFFPGMLPSTFQSPKDKEEKTQQNLKLKLEMAKFLQGTLDQMSVQHKERYSQTAKEFLVWVNKVRNSGELVTNEDIMKYSKLFEDELTLDSLSRSQLIALCRVLEVQTLGTNNFLRFQLRMKLRSLAADDKMIQKEGVDALNYAELQQACRARGMRAYGVTEERLKSQLKQWLDLSLNKQVPPSLLLLSRALMLPETIPTTDQLKATISSLPEAVVKQTQAAIGEKEGKIDNRMRAELIKEEERRVKEERLEQKEELKKKQQLQKDKELLMDKAPTISAASTPILEDTALRISTEKLEKVEEKSAIKGKEKEAEEMHAKDFEIIEHAIDKISKEKKLIIENKELQELKAEMADYKEDVEDLAKVIADQPKEDQLKETKAAKRLYKSVNRMITKLDKVLVDLEKKEAQLKKDLESGKTDKKKEELLKIDDIISAIQKIKDVPNQKKLEQIVNVLKKMDDDRDGSIKIEDALKVIEIIGKENVKLTSKQIDELIDLVDKEEILEVEDKIEKALLKDKEARLAEKQEKIKATEEKKKAAEEITKNSEEAHKKIAEHEKLAEQQRHVEDKRKIVAEHKAKVVAEQALEEAQQKLTAEDGAKDLSEDPQPKDEGKKFASKQISQVKPKMDTQPLLTPPIPPANDNKPEKML